MTRQSVNRTLSRLYWLLFLLLLLLLAAKFANDIPGIPSDVVRIASNFYEFMRDMSLLIATGGVAYISNIFQKRANFVSGLAEEWRSIVRTKSALLAYCDKPYQGTDDYLAAYSRIGETIDTMRIIYKNAGETPGLVGLYPYEPLHDMRRALHSIDPRAGGEIQPAQKNQAKEAIKNAFSALRETFLEELDLEEPGTPLLVSGARRLKKPGADITALLMQDQQVRRLEREAVQKPDKTKN